jgi:hypothetical protein
LILDNPLAFTNPKTAPIANMAFKQASDENQAKLARKYKLEDMATEFDYARRLAAMRIQGQASAMRLTPEQKFMSSQEGLVIREGINRLDQQEKDLRQSMVGKSEPAQRALARQISDINTERESLLARGRTFAASLSQDTDIGPTLNPKDFTVAPTVGAAPTARAASTAPASAQTVTGSAGNGPELPTGDLSTSDPAYSLINFDENRVAFGPMDEATPEVVQAAAPAEMPTRRAEPVLPEAPLPNPPLDIFARDQYSEPVYPIRPPFLSDEQKQAAQERREDEALRREDSWQNTPVPVKQQVVTNFVEQDPDIRSESRKLLMLQSDAKEKKDRFDIAKLKSTGASAEDIDAALLASKEANFAYERAKVDLDVKKGSLISGLYSSNDPYSIMETRVQDRIESDVRKSQMEAAQLAKRREIELAAARRTGAGTGAAKSFGADTLEARIAAENQKPMRIAEETNQQWTGAKNEIVEAAGGQAKLNQVVFDAIQDPAFGSSIMSKLSNSLGRLSLVARIERGILESMPAEQRVRISKDNKGKAFDQKAERDGLQAVYWDEVINALAEEMLTKYQAAYSNVMNPTPPSTPPSAKKSAPKSGPGEISTE